MKKLFIIILVFLSMSLYADFGGSVEIAKLTNEKAYIDYNTSENIQGSFITLGYKW